MSESRSAGANVSELFRRALRISAQNEMLETLLTKASGHRPTSRIGGTTMDAKYNWIMDNTGIRMAMNIAAFMLWLAACAVLLSF